MGLCNMQHRLCSDSTAKLRPMKLHYQFLVLPFCIFMRAGGHYSLFNILSFWGCGYLELIGTTEIINKKEAWLAFQGINEVRCGSQRLKQMWVGDEKLTLKLVWPNGSHYYIHMCTVNHMIHNRGGNSIFPSYYPCYERRLAPLMLYITPQYYLCICNWVHEDARQSYLRSAHDPSCPWPSLL